MSVDRGTSDVSGWRKRCFWPRSDVAVTLPDAPSWSQ